MVCGREEREELGIVLHEESEKRRGETQGGAEDDEQVGDRHLVTVGKVRLEVGDKSKSDN